MKYDCVKYVVDDINSFASFARLLRPAFARPEIRERATSLPGYTLVELWDAATNTCLGSWDEGWFDFAGADSVTVDQLDNHLRKHFKMKARPKPGRPASRSIKSIGRDFSQYFSMKPLEKVKRPRRIKSLEDFYRLTTNAEISVGVMLRFGLRASHLFRVRKNYILQNSMIDDSYSSYTKSQFEKSFYAKAIEQKAMILDGILNS